MKLQANITEILRLLRNLIRTGVIVEVNTQSGRCRVQTGGSQNGLVAVVDAARRERAHLVGALRR
ncbi:Phage P2 baseplate assembly protein gpV [Edwardsiella tarda]|nr:Phage P2 baseplate assembly protein gpV [Edwardsiella tarda]